MSNDSIDNCGYRAITRIGTKIVLARYSLITAIIIFSMWSGSWLTVSIDNAARASMRRRIEKSFVPEPFEAVRARVLNARLIIRKCGSYDDEKFKNINELIVTPAIGIINSQVNLESHYYSQLYIDNMGVFEKFKYLATGKPPNRIIESISEIVRNAKGGELIRLTDRAICLAAKQGDK